MIRIEKKQVVQKKKQKQQLVVVSPQTMKRLRELKHATGHPMSGIVAMLVKQAVASNGHRKPRR